MEAALKTTVTQKANLRNAFATFWLGSTELALSLETIQEVVNRPEHLVPVPLAPAYLLGLFNLRGLVVPIVDLRPILGMTGESRPDGRVAILIHEGVRVGLLFDMTAEILNIENGLVSRFEGDPGQQKVVTGAIRLENGERIVQVLDPRALIHIENVPQVTSDQKTRMVEIRQQRSRRKQCITFRAGAMSFALDISAIHEIIRVPDIKESPLGFEFAKGVITLRGQLIPIVDLARLLEVPVKPPLDAESRRIIILKMDGVRVGFLVESINSIVSYHAEDVLAIPLMSERRLNMFRGLLTSASGGEAVFLHDDRILTREEFEKLTRTCGRLYGNGEAAAQETERQKAQRKMFLTFRLELNLSVPLAEIEEIAEGALNLIRPPGYPTSVKGILTMRGVAITVIDMRALFGRPPSAGEGKILIVRGAKGKYGLWVDGVESIDTVDESEKIPLPAPLAQEYGNVLSGGIKEIVQMKDLNGHIKAYMILDMQYLIRRVDEMFT